MGAMWLSWQAAAVLCGVLGGLGLAVRPRPRTRLGPLPLSTLPPVARELALVLGLYAIWQLAGTLSVMHTTDAFGRARWIWDAERFVHLPSEVSLQHAVLPHPGLVRAANTYYAYVHVPALIAFLVWLFFRHRNRYPEVRTTLALATGASLLIQLVPVAPPRMLTDLGFVDTGLVFHQSVYGAFGQGMADQLSAMPSVHVVWAVLIGVAVVAASPSRWRFAALAHPVVTIFVVTVTANHWWADGIVGVVLLVLSYSAQHGARAAFASRAVERVPAELVHAHRHDPVVSPHHRGARHEGEPAQEGIA